MVQKVGEPGAVKQTLGKPWFVVAMGTLKAPVVRGKGHSTVEAPYGWAAARLGVGPAPHLFRAPTQSLGGGGCGPDPPNLRLQETRQAPKE